MRPRIGLLALLLAMAGCARQPVAPPEEVTSSAAQWGEPLFPEMIDNPSDATKIDVPIRSTDKTLPAVAELAEQPVSLQAAEHAIDSVSSDTATAAPNENSLKKDAERQFEELVLAIAGQAVENIATEDVKRPAESAALSKVTADTPQAPSLELARGDHHAKPAVAASVRPLPAPLGLMDVAARPAEKALLAGLRAYDDARFATAEKRLASALKQGLASPRDRGAAHKHLAFIYCTSRRIKLCKSAFRSARAADPAFALSRAEAGHPVWGPIYEHILP